MIFGSIWAIPGRFLENYPTGTNNLKSGRSMKPITLSDWAQKADLRIWEAAASPFHLIGKGLYSPQIRMD